MAGADTQRSVATLTVPLSLNCEALSQFKNELKTLLAQKSLQLLVLRGHSTQFCSGMDLAELTAEADPQGAPLWKDATEDFVQVLELLLEAKSVTVAAIEGAALGGGVGLVAACDIIIASEKATFALPELLLGLVPAMILPVLGSRIGFRRARYWALSQETWPATEAHRVGLVDQVAAAESFDSALSRRKKELLRLHPRGVEALKRFTPTVTGMPIPEGIKAGRELLVGLLDLAEVRQGLADFRDYGILPGVVTS